MTFSRPKFRVLIGVLVLLLLCGPVRAQGRVVEGPNFLVLDGVSGLDGCLPRDLAKRTMRDRVLSANEEAGIDPEFGVVFALEVPPCADLFYAAVSNDVRGIGYQHFYDQELFDESPLAALEGVAFLNDVPYWELYPDELTRAFFHEIGHRWSARVHVAGDDPTALLGRDLEHWSYFLDASRAGAVSPLEGNIWEGEAPDFSSATHEASSAFSDLDLYLMGVLAPEDVDPLVLLRPAVDQPSPTDCRGASLHPSSPPQRCEPVVLSAETASYSIEDVMQVEGPREPEASAEARVKTVAFYFLTSEGRWTESACRHWSAEVDRLTRAFSVATGGRMSLENAWDFASDCAGVVDRLSRADVDSGVPAQKGSCAFAPRRGRFSSVWAILLGVWGLRRLLRQEP